MAPTTDESAQVERLAAIFFDSTPDALFWIDASTQAVLRCNRSAMELLGRTEAEVVGQPHLSIYPPEQREDLQSLFEMYDDAVEHAVQVQVPGEDETRHFLVHTNEAELDGLRVLQKRFRDITDEVKAKRLLQRRSEDLAKANAELKDFTYIVSHDLRAPMINLKGFASEIRAGLTAVTPIIESTLSHLNAQERDVIDHVVFRDITEALDFIDSSVARLEHMISRLLKLSRVGRQEMNYEAVDVEELLDTLSRTMKHQQESTNSTLDIGPMPVVRADRAALDQVFGNLLLNAFQYLRPGRPGRIVVRHQQAPEEHIFSVSDNGRGIAREDVDKVFSPFRRLGDTDTQGEGMGLSYARVLVGRHEGQIWCESRLGEGTTFRFTIATQLKRTEQGEQRDDSSTRDVSAR